MKLSEILEFLFMYICEHGSRKLKKNQAPKLDPNIAKFDFYCIFISQFLEASWCTCTHGTHSYGAPADKLSCTKFCDIFGIKKHIATLFIALFENAFRDNKAYKELGPLKLISQALKSWQALSAIVLCVPEFAKTNNRIQ